jgi:hypothetical protein
MPTDDRLPRWVAARPIKWGFVVALAAVFIIGPFSGVYSFFPWALLLAPVVGDAN